MFCPTIAPVSGRSSSALYVCCPACSVVGTFTEDSICVSQDSFRSGIEFEEEIVLTS